MSAEDDHKSNEELRRWFTHIANGNPSGGAWLSLYHDWCHEVDDVIDLPDWSPETLLKVLVRACEVYSHPFYVKNCKHLQGVCILATAEYSDSINWERAPELFKRQWAEVMRHAGNHVIYTVALLCGGYEHLLNFSGPWRAMCYVYHKDKYGTPS